jgi:hypothetical protein
MSGDTAVQVCAMRLPEADSIISNPADARKYFFIRFSPIVSNVTQNCAD